MIILIPCKSLRAGKSRLSLCLSDRERRHLCERLLDDTLDLATSVVDASLVRVVTADSDARKIASRHQVPSIADTTGELNSALHCAREQLARESAGSVPLLFLPIDLPFATRDAVSRAIAQPADIVIAPDEGGTGTNLLLLREAAWDFALHFGPNSFSRHVSQARAAGLSLAIASDWRLARDIDDSEQYAAWAAPAAANQ